MEKLELVFFGIQKGLFYYLPKGQTINEEYYARLSGLKGEITATPSWLMSVVFLVALRDKGENRSFHLYLSKLQRWIRRCHTFLPFVTYFYHFIFPCFAFKLTSFQPVRWKTWERKALVYKRGKKSSFSRTKGFGNGKTEGFEKWILGTSSLFYIFGSILLLSIPNNLWLENILGWM